MEELISAFFVAFGDVIIYRLGKGTIYIMTIGQYRGEDRSKRDPDDIDSFDAAKGEISQEVTWSVGFTVFFAILGACIYIAVT